MTIVLMGGGGHCRACLEVIAGVGLQVTGILDSQPVAADMPGRLGDDSWLDSASARGLLYLVTVGQVDVAPRRRLLFENLVKRGLECATVMAANATISGRTSIGAGTIVMQRAVINRGAVVGRNCIINTSAIIEHDARIADHCHVSTGAIANGGVQIGEGCMIGSGAIILPGIKIAPNVVVGAGAVVTRDIEAAGSWWGIPARRAP